MADQLLLDRIHTSPNVMTGKPVVRGTRVTVEHILNLLAHDLNVADVLAEYPGLTSDDIKACLAYAGRIIERERLSVVAS